MHGRKPRLPVDLAFDFSLRDDGYRSHSSYVRSLKPRLEQSYKIDVCVTAAKVEAVCAARLRGKHKLADKWESDVYMAVKQAGGLPVYSIKPENKDAPRGTVHRDLLLPYVMKKLTRKPITR